MDACGLIVEYNPFHNGHHYHIQEARKVSKADCIIAVMSGNFLQRGEPAIIDKFHRAKAALASGCDLVLELPYAFSVQNSDHFAYGAVNTLHAIGVSSICFGSESGNVSHFINSYKQFENQKHIYETELKIRLNTGASFPEASMHAYAKIGLKQTDFDLSLPNNILGFSYVKNVLDKDLPIRLLTIKRVDNHFHDSDIKGRIASATSIRKELFSNEEKLTPKIEAALPGKTIEQLKNYKQKTGLLHDWEQYFQFLHYRVQTMSIEELQEIHGADEGIEYRIKTAAKTAENMKDWIEKVKTKRYTWTRIQRLFVHILTNTKQADLIPFLEQEKTIPHVRILGMTKRGQNYLNTKRKELDIEIISGLKRDIPPLLQLEEKAARAYYSILPPAARMNLFKQETGPPILIND